MIRPNVTSFQHWRAVPLDRRAFFVFFFVLVTAAWVLLFVWSRRHNGALIEPNTETSYLFLDPSFLAGLCSAPTAETSIGISVSMWALMSLAMMLPTAVPIFTAYHDLTLTKPDDIHARNIWGLLGGYCTVWLGYSVAAGSLQWALAKLGLVSTHGRSVSAPLSVSLLLVAGIYQFSQTKAACLSRCRSPLAFFLSQWKDKLSGAFKMGLRHGLDCLGCCWALMLLAFVGGTMNLAWMGLATGLMILEKLPALGRPLTKPLGIMLICGAIYIVWGEINSMIQGVYP